MTCRPRLCRSPFRWRISWKRAFLPFRPHPVADAFRDTSGTTPTLIGLRTAHPLGHKTGHATARIKPRAAGPACVYDDADVCPACEEYITPKLVSRSDLRPMWYIFLGMTGMIAVLLVLSGLISLMG